ncbi:unnamed protein product [Meloidogyne enterolobii]|uniref:Uncharacterized protein n=1 Tax=Meloidogyne enterolobii TaxID=390850 RepID=A0ACB0Y123_MELEN
MRKCFMQAEAIVIASRRTSKPLETSKNSVLKAMSAAMRISTSLIQYAASCSFKLKGSFLCWSNHLSN